MQMIKSNVVHCITNQTDQFFELEHISTSCIFTLKLDSYNSVVFLKFNEPYSLLLDYCFYQVILFNFYKHKFMLKKIKSLFI